jgi:hypothetical protein
MCDVVGCDTEWTTEAISARKVTTQLCAAHKAPELRTGCLGCRVVLQVGEKAIKAIRTSEAPRPSHAYGGGQLLCHDCNRLSSPVVCANCTRVARLNGKVLSGGVGQDEPFAWALCGTCLPGGYTRCSANCGRLARVGTTLQPGAAAVLGADPAQVTCGTCTTAGTTQCNGCRKLVLVGGKVVGGVRVKPYRGRLYLCSDTAGCESRVTRRCKLCDTPARLSTTTRLGAAVELAGGTWRCMFCAPDRVTAITPTNPLIVQVLQFLDRFLAHCGVPRPGLAGRITWQLATDAQMTTGASTSHRGQTYGHCTSVGLAHTIQLLGDVPPLRFQQTVAHELAHAVTNELGLDTHANIEGFCNWAAYLFLAEVRNTEPQRAGEAQRLIDLMEKEQNPTYGENFLLVRRTIEAPSQSFNYLRGTYP